MISIKEVLKSARFEDQSEEIKANLAELLSKVNKVRTAYGKAMTVTSGLRTMEDHLRIYREKAKKEGKEFDESKVPKKSLHLYGMAVDISDPKGELQKWCLDNKDRLIEIGLWMEHFSATPTWVHFQIKPPGSGARFFHP